VCIYVVGGAGEELPLDAWRRLAPALTELADRTGLTSL
jgi:hypothetical protein